MMFLLTLYCPKTTLRNKKYCLTMLTVRFNTHLAVVLYCFWSGENNVLSSQTHPCLSFFTFVLTFFPLLLLFHKANRSCGLRLLTEIGKSALVMHCQALVFKWGTHMLGSSSVMSRCEAI